MPHPIHASHHVAYAIAPDLLQNPQMLPPGLVGTLGYSRPASWDRLEFHRVCYSGAQRYAKRRA